MRSLRILIVTFTFPPNKDGVAESARFMAEDFARRGHVVTVVTGCHPDRNGEDFGERIKVHQFRVEGSPNLLEGIHGEVEEFKRFVASFTGDVIIVQCWHVWSSALAEAVFSRTPHSKKVLMSHGFAAQVWVPQRRFPWGLGRWLGMQPWLWGFPRRLRRYDRVVINSHRANLGRFMDHLLAKATGYGKVSIIPNSTEPGKFEGPRGAFRGRHGLGDRLLFLNVANYSERKNQELAVRAFARARLRQAVIVFIGSTFNGYSEHVQRVAADLGLGPDEVLFLEGVDRPETCAAFIDCDVFVLSAKAETMPFVLLEAMACGKPFVTTKTGCVQDLVGGYVVRTETEMADRFRELAHDSERRAHLGRIGRAECLAKYTGDKVGEQWARLLEELVT
jgi:glycosyltransferase involved in cell wall biosynthesis